MVLLVMGALRSQWLRDFDARDKNLRLACEGRGEGPMGPNLRRPQSLSTPRGSAFRVSAVLGDKQHAVTNRLGRRRNRVLPVEETAVHAAAVLWQQAAEKLHNMAL